MLKVIMVHEERQLGLRLAYAKVGDNFLDDF